MSRGSRRDVFSTIRCSGGKVGGEPDVQQFGQMDRIGAARRAAIHHSFHDLASNARIFEPKRRGGLFVEWKAIPFET